MRNYYQIYMQDKNGISMWEDYDNLEDATIYFENIRKYEPTKTNGHYYELLAISEDMNIEDENLRVDKQSITVLESFSKIKE